MMTAKAMVALLLAYVLALAAGTTSGLLVDRLRGEQAGSAAPLAAQLQLTPVQAEQMRGVWEQVNLAMDSYFQAAQLIERQRDQALVDVLTDDQKAKFAVTDKEYAERFAALGASRRAAFREGLAKTEAMLNPSQRVKYEQIVRERLGRFPLDSEAATEPSADPRSTSLVQP